MWRVVLSSRTVSVSHVAFRVVESRRLGRCVESRLGWSVGACGSGQVRSVVMAGSETPCVERGGRMVRSGTISNGAWCQVGKAREGASGRGKSLR